MRWDTLSTSLVRFNHFHRCPYPDDEGSQGHVDEHEVGLGHEARVELAHLVEVVQPVLDAVHVAHDDELTEPDEEVRPPGGVEVEEIQQVSAALENAILKNF